jgi:hypothetical protein
MPGGIYGNIAMTLMNPLLVISNTFPLRIDSPWPFPIILTMTAMTSEEKHVSRRGCLKSKRARILLAVLVFIVLCAAVIPAVVVTTLRKKNSMGPKSKVFVPLYVYPAPGAWSPLEKV